MIKSFQHKGLERFHYENNKAGIQSKHADRLIELLTALEYASKPSDLNTPNYNLHPLKGQMRVAGP